MLKGKSTLKNFETRCRKYSASTPTVATARRGEGMCAQGARGTCFDWAETSGG